MHICVSPCTFTEQHISHIGYRDNKKRTVRVLLRVANQTFFFLLQIVLDSLEEQVGFHFSPCPEVPQADNKGSHQTESTPAHLSELSKPPERWPAYNPSKFPPALSAGTFRPWRRLFFLFLAQFLSKSCSFSLVHFVGLHTPSSGIFFIYSLPRSSFISPSKHRS